jgi:phosphatidylserine/phosphatidylglycerophosphate/cardiolipin synthase-like enzyme
MARTIVQLIGRRFVLLIALLSICGGALLTQGDFRDPRTLLDTAATILGIDLGLPPRPAVLRQTGDGAIAVFFTTPGLVYPDVPRNRILPPHVRAILTDLDRARQSIDYVTFEYGLQPIAEALVRAQRRGVRVRVALDRENLVDPVEARFAGTLEAAGIPVAWETSTAFLHSKFIIVDERTVWTGSWNTTNNDTYRNNNNVLRITIPQVVANYQAEFAELHAGRFSTSKQARTPHSVIATPSLVLHNAFSPREPVEAQIVALVEQAQQRVEFLAFSFTSDRLGDTLIARHAAGVAVRGVFERRNAGGLGSAYHRLQGAGLAVYPDGNCYTMHHKVIIIDGRIVITGSYNYSARAERTNDENTLIIVDAAIAQAYQAEFERVYRQARNPVRCR